MNEFGKDKKDDNSRKLKSVKRDGSIGEPSRNELKSATPDRGIKGINPGKIGGRKPENPDAKPSAPGRNIKTANTDKSTGNQQSGTTVKPKDYGTKSISSGKIKTADSGKNTAEKPSGNGSKSATSERNIKTVTPGKSTAKFTADGSKPATSEKKIKTVDFAKNTTGKPPETGSKSAASERNIKTVTAEKSTAKFTAGGSKSAASEMKIKTADSAKNSADKKTSGQDMKTVTYVKSAENSPASGIKPPNANGNIKFASPANIKGNSRNIKGVKRGKKGVKSGGGAGNLFTVKPIGKDDVTDTGTESLRLAKSTADRTAGTLKTVQNIVTAPMKTVKDAVVSEKTRDLKTVAEQKLKKAAPQNIRTNNRTLKVKNKREFKVKKGFRILRKIGKGGMKFAAGTAFSAAKSGLKSANPFSQNINVNDVGDTGAETVRLARQGVDTAVAAAKTAKKTVTAPYNAVKSTAKAAKTTVKTVKSTGRVLKSAVTRIGKDIRNVRRTVKTATRSVRLASRGLKTAKTAAETAKFTVKIMYSTVRGTAKVAYIGGKLLADAAVHLVAAAFNPAVLAAAGILMIFMMFGSLIVLIVGGGSTDNNAKAAAAVGAVGLETETSTVVDVYFNGVDFLNISLEDLQNGFNAMIDGLYMNPDDMPHSDLVFMGLTKADGSSVQYQTGFAYDEQKTQLKNAWEFPLTANEIIAIAYVKLEKDMNAEQGTANEIYFVELTQAVIDEIMVLAAVYTDTVYPNQPCPDKGCTPTVETVPNPEYYAKFAELNAAAENYNNAVDALNGMTEPEYSAQLEYITNVLGPEYERLDAELAGIPPTTEIPGEPACYREHNLHAVELAFLSKEALMDALGFNEADKQWAEMTQWGFENNPEITGV
jgi:hypoxanthine phosphoribosyltransferase